MRGIFSRWIFPYLWTTIWDPELPPGGAGTSPKNPILDPELLHGGSYHQFATVQRSWNDTWTSWTGCGLFQPIWKIWSSKWVHLPQFSGWKFKKIKTATWWTYGSAPCFLLLMVQKSGKLTSCSKKTRLFEIHPRWLAGLFHQQYQPVTALRHRCVAASWPVQTGNLCLKNAFFRMWLPNPLTAPQIEPPTKPAFQFSIGNICHSSHHHGSQEWDVSNISFLSFRLYNFPLPWLWEKGFAFYIFIHSFIHSFIHAPSVQPPILAPKKGSQTLIPSYLHCSATVKKPGGPGHFPCVILVV